MRLSYVVVLVAIVGCKREKQKEPRFEGPMPVAFGDCAGPATSWISGPKPLPFTPEEANGVGTSDEVVADAAPSPDHPSPDDDRAALGQTEGGGFASLIGTGDISSGFDDTNIYGGLLGNEAGEMNGGFGYGTSGFGPGGGGTGWGTIGTGRYGTIGHGSGTGSGYGVGGGRGGLRGRTAAVPTVSIGQPNAQGDLDKAIIRRYIKRNIQKITYCYEKQLLVNPKLAGTVQTQFFITPKGDVASASGSGVDPNVSTCVAGVIKAIEFPKPKGGGGVQVNYPFTFRPAGGGDVASTPPAAPLPDAGSADTTAAVGGGSATPPTPASKPPTRPRRLFRDIALSVANAGDYKPGSTNPLRAQEAPLVECLRKNPSHYGALVVDLAYDASGRVTKAEPHGLTDERTRKCILDVTNKVTHAGTPAERCSVSFGVMPVSALPAIEITADTVTLDGQQVAATKTVMTDDLPLWRIDALVDAVEKKRKTATSASAPIVQIHGPLVIKPLDATPMKVVWRVITSVIAAGDDSVLATSQGSDWTLLAPLELPVVPVPFTTGGVWNHIVKATLRDLASVSDDDEHVKLSILVTKNEIWFGLSRVNEFEQIPRDANLGAKVNEALKKHKQSAFFVDRNDLEIAGDDDVTYSDVVHVIQAASSAGFSHWQLTSPQRLAARPQL